MNSQEEEPSERLTRSATKGKKKPSRYCEEVNKEPEFKNPSDFEGKKCRKSRPRSRSVSQEISDEEKVRRKLNFFEKQ